MNILFVLEHYYPYIGGAETLFQDLAESLAAQGHHVTVATLLFQKDLGYFEVHNQVNIVRINCRNRYLFSFLSLPTVLRLAHKADVIHTTTYNAALPAWISAKIRRKKVVVTFHEVWGNLWFRLPFISTIAATAFYSFEQLLLFLPFDHYVAVSDATRTSLLQHKVAEQRLSRIYNGLDYTQFSAYPPAQPAVFTYTYFGRLGISKGLDLLLPAAEKFACLHPETRLQLIIPRVPKAMFTKINELIDHHQLREHITLLHELPRTELHRTVAASSCVVIPSYSEGFCFVAAEAVALGVPMISSGQGALAETVSGHYLELEDMTVEAMLSALEKAYAKEYAFREKRYFHLHDSVKEYLELYQRL